MLFCMGRVRHLVNIYYYHSMVINITAVFAINIGVKQLPLPNGKRTFNSGFLRIERTINIREYEKNIFTDGSYRANAVFM